MKKIKAGLYVFFKSMTSPRYYKDLLSVDFKFSIKYFIILAFFAFIATFPSTALSIINTFDNSFNKFTNEVVNLFPEDLEIKIKNGKLSTNKEKPYIVAAPEGYTETNEGPNNYIKNLVVIDPNGNVDDLKKYETLFLVNRSNVISKRSNKVKVFPLRDIPDTTIVKKDVEMFFQKVKPYFKVLPFVLVFFTAITSAIIYFAERAVFYLVPVAIILQIISLILNSVINKGGKNKERLTLSFKKSYQVAIHAMTFPLVVEVLADILEFPINAPFWFLLVNLIFSITGLLYIAKKNVNSTNND